MITLLMYIRENADNMWKQMSNVSRELETLRIKKNVKNNTVRDTKAIWMGSSVDATEPRH